ncbi:peptidylprolyl isomerase [Aquiflexum sp. LQ15W]|uniref:peptidylprolyl isomerase n=1 Tax=Cognataquiflexum nitidum TaxID=2922272 RepID=UPI001F1350A4|nr:peptidylprolyl isomerase [Cognataquiflexum nitidum]MCH6198169.1 peptidylprolyl isomerase [Cognataquiflexum nitidum]
MKRLSFIPALILVLVLFSCSVEKDYVIKIQTKHGDMYAVLFDQTPKHKQNFIDLAQAGRFDSTEFHRIIKGFMIQGGDVFTKEKLPADTWPTVEAEIVPGLIHKKGMIAAARMGDNVNPERKSSGSQFYIVQGKTYNKDELVTDMKLLSETYFKFIQLGSNLALKEEYARMYQTQQFDSLNQRMLSEKANLEAFYNLNLEKSMTSDQVQAYTTVGGTLHLDGEYTVFGEVILGLDVMEKIANVPTGDKSKPIEPIHMTVTVELISKSKITKEFGYVY